ncbi:MAG: GGDEF domain-containing protein [Candidatus Obscuribacterales bacterium]|nr:GGDEF domain-containing protein [Candidatus Obscuribacterales bacterium]
MTERNLSMFGQGNMYDRVREDLKKRRPLLGAAFQGDPETLARVREYEQRSSEVAQQVGLVAAKGEDIERLALLDPVTELYNHRTFVKELKAEMARSRRYSQRVSVCSLIVDNFDNIGTDYGTLTQDAVLKVVALVIRNSTREVDIAARYAPWQFAVVLPQTNAAGASLVAERIRLRVAAQVFSHNWKNFSITSSIGVATFPEHAPEYDELVARSIEAMECALDRGGDRVFSF